MNSSKAAEKLPHIRRPHKMLQPQVANTSPQKYPQDPVVEHAKSHAASMQQPIAPSVKSSGLQPVDPGPRQRPLQFLAHPPHHFRRGIVGIGQRQNFVRTSMPFADQVGHALRQDSSLPCPRARNHQHRPMNMLNSLPLPLIGDNGNDGNDLLRRRCRR